MGANLADREASSGPRLAPSVRLRPRPGHGTVISLGGALNFSRSVPNGAPWLLALMIVVLVIGMVMDAIFGIITKRIRERRGHPWFTCHEHAAVSRVTSRQGGDVRRRPIIARFDRDG